VARKQKDQTANNGKSETNLDQEKRYAGLSIGQEVRITDSGGLGEKGLNDPQPRRTSMAQIGKKKISLIRTGKEPPVREYHWRQ